MLRDCPKRTDPSSGQLQQRQQQTFAKGKGKAFNLTVEEAETAEGVVEGTCLPAYNPYRFFCFLHALSFFGIPLDTHHFRYHTSPFFSLSHFIRLWSYAFVCIISIRGSTSYPLRQDGYGLEYLYRRW
jgi:hypothetical protein